MPNVQSANSINQSINQPINHCKLNTKLTKLNPEPNLDHWSLNLPFRHLTQLESWGPQQFQCIGHLIRAGPKQLAAPIQVCIICPCPITKKNRTTGKREHLVDSKQHNTHVKGPDKLRQNWMCYQSYAIVRWDNMFQKPLDSGHSSKDQLICQQHRAQHEVRTVSNSTRTSWRSRVMTICIAWLRRWLREPSPPLLGI